jgi:UDP-3-O-[3-hydroxymyristoyl] glucosamine N-acyltransferase
MKIKLSEITNIVDVEIIRDGEFECLGWVKRARENMLTFLESQKFLEDFLQISFPCSLITTGELAKDLPENYGIAVSPNPRKAFYQLHNYLATRTEFYWQDFTSEISPLATIHPRAFVAEKNVRIGKGAIIEPGVMVLERSIIGEEVIIRAGTVIGSQGFEFKRMDGGIMSIAHAGCVRLHDRVEVQANCGISRSVFGGATELGEDTKLDNLVHIAHNVQVGKRCLMAAAAMIAGSVIIGDDVWIGPGAIISSEITIGDRSQITIGSLVTKSIPSDQRVVGTRVTDIIKKA